MEFPVPIPDMLPLTRALAGPAPRWIAVGLALLNLVAIGRAIVRGHGVSSTLAWILAVLAFPGVGAVAYLLLANPGIGRTVRRRASAASETGASPLPVAGLDETERRIVQLAGELSGLGGSAGNRVDLLVEDEGAFERIEEALAGARRSIWAENYIVRNDATGHRFLELLAGRAAAGVDVRLLYDAVGSLGLDGARLRAIRDAGGQAEPFLPVNPLRRRWAVHLRNHRKLTIVDGTAAFTGGMNVGDEHAGRSRRRGVRRFRDTHLRVEGPSVRDFASVFADDWKFATGESLALPEGSGDGAGSSVVCPLPSGPDQRFNASAHAFFAGVASARRSCYVTTPYFIPDEPMLRALVTAASSGVDVRVMVPLRNDAPLVGAAARSYYPELIGGGVRVFEYGPAMLHAKSMVVDGRWGIVGSANVDIRSFRLNFEIGALVLDPVFAGKLTRRFLSDLGRSVEVTPAALRATSLARRLLQGVARLLSPLL
jgi:cardiolipin synthase